ncbi:hypothetical protein INT48_000372 [Thamnidium elegans]|uniref:FAD-binding domain-containing protein n=1 Tax=Thamnidium elegans TaxID=101142 RepID=A0A8H7SMM1_9FUNG|nr:hypothetical protein INT48_000372 [Thamnidium elegans]
MPKSISVLIVGGGIGGLSAAIALQRSGHRITVLEGAKEFSEIGAGIQVPPNTACILDAWGLLDKLKENAVCPSSIIMRRYANGEIICAAQLKPDMTDKYKYPYLLIHRADYVKLLYDAAVDLGVKVIVNARVQSVDEETNSVILYNGKSFQSDLVIGADGIRSKVRRVVIGDNEIAPYSTNCAFRATVSAEVMRSDPEISRFMNDVSSNFWIGPKRHVVGYPIKDGTLYNLVMILPGVAAADKWNEFGDLNEMKESYNDFDPVLKKILSYVTSCRKWALAELPSIAQWVSRSGTIALVGDAAHAMLPCLAQGAAQAIEDSATLGILLSNINSLEDIPSILRIYERIRRPRTQIIQKQSFENCNSWHLPDGPEQRARDDAMSKADAFRRSETKVEGVKSPLQWSDKDFQPWLYGHNAISVAKNVLQEIIENPSSLEERPNL